MRQRLFRSVRQGEAEAAFRRGKAWLRVLEAARADVTSSEMEQSTDYHFMSLNSGR